MKRGLVVTLVSAVIAVVGPLASPAGATRVTLLPPHGWTIKPSPVQGGLVTALKPADITAAVPGGPRFTIQPSGATVPDVVSLVRTTDPTFTGVPAAASATVGSKPAAGLTWTETRAGKPVTSNLLVVSFGQGQAYTVLMEAPAAQWAASAKSFKAILASVKFS